MQENTNQMKLRSDNDDDNNDINNNNKIKTMKMSARVLRNMPRSNNLLMIRAFQRMFKSSRDYLQ